LINNAGLGHHSPLLTGSPSHWKEILDVNVLALSHCSMLAVEQMRQRGDDGSIIHVSSMSAHRVTQSGMYSASKFAVRALTEGLRLELRELGSNIRVGAISPGFVETEFAERYHKSAEKARETYSRYPVIQSEDVAEQVLFMLKQPAHVQIHDILVRPTQQPS
jgi:NADP-dependent 3-hydroxy acid dehydrogenase YdfG